jgi:putative protein kinase ArgK-like GTPase of G3E family
VVATNATGSDGIGLLWQAIEGHRAHLETSGKLERTRRERLVREVETRALESMRANVRGGLERDAGLAEDLLSRRIDPYRAASILEERVAGA